jgi:hypothetical protein
VFLATADQPLPKEVVVGVLGAAAGVAGLVLVFVGVLLTTIASYPGATSAAALRPYRSGAWAGLVVFVAAVATVALAIVWLAILDAHWLYVLILALFAAVLVVLVALAASVVKATT